MYLHTHTQATDSYASYYVNQFISIAITYFFKDLRYFKELDPYLFEENKTNVFMLLET